MTFGLFWTFRTFGFTTLLIIPVTVNGWVTYFRNSFSLANGDATIITVMETGIINEHLKDFGLYIVDEIRGMNIAFDEFKSRQPFKMNISVLILKFDTGIVSTEEMRFNSEI